MLARAHILLVVYWRLPTTFVCRKFRRLFLRSMEVLFVLFIPYKNPRRQKFWSRSEQLNFPWGINITSLSPNRYPTHSSRPTFRRNTSLAFKPSSLLFLLLEKGSWREKLWSKAWALNFFVKQVWFVIIALGACPLLARRHQGAPDPWENPRRFVLPLKFYRRTRVDLCGCLREVERWKRLRPLWSPRQRGCRHCLVGWPNLEINPCVLYACCCCDYLELVVFGRHFLPQAYS
jgi:hypothetical protein